MKDSNQFQISPSHSSMMLRVFIYSWSNIRQGTSSPKQLLVCKSCKKSNASPWVYPFYSELQRKREGKERYTLVEIFMLLEITLRLVAALGCDPSPWNREVMRWALVKQDGAHCSLSAGVGALRGLCSPLLTQCVPYLFCLPPAWSCSIENSA